jgi:protein ImuB
MYWIALLPSHEDERIAWGWRALQFTPRVAQVDEALLLEVSACERLWGGRKRLLRRLLRQCEPLAAAHWAKGETSLIALAALRLQLRGEALPERLPQDLPLDALTAAREHADTLERTGCRTWGELRALPRGGVSRRFGAELLDALDAAYGERPERYPWLQLPEAFDLKFELAALATTAPELMWAAQRLLSQLQVWLQARHRGVLALELEWTLDLRRLNGVRLPSHEQLVVRTAQPTQDIAHLRRLVGEHLSRAALSAPANHLRLRSLETVPWGGANTSLLPEDNVKGERLHQLVERLSVRLGEGNVRVPQALADHRPERMQAWVPARDAVIAGDSTVIAGGSAVIAGSTRNPGDAPPPSGLRIKSAMTNAKSAMTNSDALYPPWLLPHPLPLEVRNDVPHYGGPLRRLTRLYRIETGWWEDGRPALRDYFIARSEEAGLVWIYRERPLQLTQGLEQARSFRWYLQGLYA